MNVEKVMDRRLCWRCFSRKREREGESCERFWLFRFIENIQEYGICANKTVPSTTVPYFSLTERCQLVGLHFELLLDVGPFFGSENCSVEYRFNRRSTDWTTTPRCIITGAIIAVLMQLI